MLGAFGLPRLGGAGCGWATMISFALLVFAWTLYALFAPALRGYRLWQGFGAPIVRELRAMLALGPDEKPLTAMVLLKGCLLYTSRCV